MLEMICAIPEEIGWVLVGVMATLTAIMAVKLAKILIIMAWNFVVGYVVPKMKQLWENYKNRKTTRA